LVFIVDSEDSWVKTTDLSDADGLAVTGVVCSEKVMELMAIVLHKYLINGHTHVHCICDIVFIKLNQKC